MTSRERVLNAIERRPVDRVPYSFRAEPETYDKVKRERNLATDEEVRLWSKSDFRDISLIFAEGGHGGYTGFGWRDKELPDGTQEDFWGVRRKKVSYDGGYYVDICHWPLKTATPEEIKSFTWPDPAKIFDFSGIDERVKSFNIGNDYWCHMEVESLFDRCWTLRGMEQFMSDLLAEPEVADIIIGNMADFFYKRTEMLLKEAKGSIHSMGLYDDLGTQESMMISPRIYRELFKERQRQIIELIKSHGVKVFYHSCGAIEPVIEDLIEIGVDILDPLQLMAMGTTPEYMADKYGSRITFHGGVDTQDLLPNGTPEEVGAEVKHLIKALSANGGFILSGAHYYQIDIPVDNLEAITMAM